MSGLHHSLFSGERKFDLLLMTIVASTLFFVVGVSVLLSMFSLRPAPFLGLLFLVGFGVLIIRGNYWTWLGIGVLCPFLLTLLHFRGIPAFAISLLFCLGALVVRNVVVSGPQPSSPRSYDVLTAVFFLYIVIRYAVDPALPGYTLGISQDISGFRSWFDHLMNLIVVIFLGMMIRQEIEVVRLLRIMVITSVILATLLIVVMFLQSPMVTLILRQMGVLIVYFNNGLRRFVILPHFGAIVMMGALLPDACGISRRFAVWLFPYGILAVLAGGNRSSFLGVLAAVGSILVLKRRWMTLGMFAAVMVTGILSVNIMQRQGFLSVDNPLARVFGIWNAEIAKGTGGTDTVGWRLQRWRRAAEDICRHPWFGMGYGRMKDYFAYTPTSEAAKSDLEVERDLALGTTHNGYVSAARALGIPAVVLFVLIVMREIACQCSRVWGHRVRNERERDVVIWIASSLVMYVGILVVSGEIRMQILWLFLALSRIVARLRVRSIIPQSSSGVSGSGLQNSVGIGIAE